MNSKILAPKKNIGAITIKKLQGGETTLETVFQDVHHADIDALNGYTNEELREHLEELKEKRGRTPVKDRVVRSSLTKRISAITKILNRRKSIRPRKINYKYSTKEFQAHVEYEVGNSINESMIRNGLDSIYEIQNGDNMNEKKIHVKEVTNEHGQPDYEVTYERNVPDSNNGALKMKDLVSLYHSNRLYLFDSPIDKKGIQDESIIIYNLVEMIKNPSVFINVRMEQDGKTFLTPIWMLERRVFHLRDRSTEEISFLLNLKGDAIKVGNCKYYNQDEEKWIELKALSYNQLDYENNHVVVIAKPSTLNHIENRCKKLHEEYYHFENKEGELIHGLYGLSNHEENALKQMKREKSGFDESEIQELFDVLKEIDGRQTIRNIEYDIKAHTGAKYLFQKHSDELFFLKMALEDTPEYAEEVLDSVEYESYLEVIGYLQKQMERVTKKKITALRNVVSGLHLRYENEEDLGKYLSDELDEVDKVAQDRNFSFNKTHRNYYSQTEGVLVPNGNPQTTHRRRSNPPSMSSLRILRKRHGFSIGGLYAGVSDPKILSKVYTGPGESNFIKEVMNFDKEYERVFGVKTPTPSTSFRAYPWYPIHDILGLDEEDKDVLLETFSEVQGYLTKDRRDFLREAIFTALDEKYPAPQFRVPTPPALIDYSKVCNRCKHEGACFIKKVKRYNDLRLLTPYAEKELGFTEYDGDVIRGVLEEVKGYLPNERLPVGFKEVKGIKLLKEKIYKEKKEEEDSSSLPSFRIVGDNMVEVKINGKMVPLYAKGDLSILEFPSVSIAGTRTPSEETAKFIKDTITDLADEYVIVSGLALGCDTIAHRAALDANGLTIAVLPCGFNNISPDKNTKLAEEIVAKGGLLLSEYPPEEGAFKKRYVQRNRIIAALSETVIICEAGNGTKHTARFAEKQKKNILVQRINTFNNNSMIELGIGRFYQRDWVI